MRKVDSRSRNEKCRHAKWQKSTVTNHKVSSRGGHLVLRIPPPPSPAGSGTANFEVYGGDAAAPQTLIVRPLNNTRASWVASRAVFNMRRFLGSRAYNCALVGLLIIASTSVEPAYGGKEENLDEMSWIYNTAHINMYLSKLGVKILDVEMGEGEKAIKGDLCVPSLRVAPPRWLGLAVGGGIP
eukprot:1193730-Prorocentrum_minimum.AAC.3